MSYRTITSRLPRAAALAASSMLALGGVLAITASASATQLPTGTLSGGAYSGFGPAAGLEPVILQGVPVYDQAANMLQSAGDPAMQNGGQSWSGEDALNDPSQITADFLGQTEAGNKPTTGDYLAKVKSTDPTYRSDAAQIRSFSQLLDGIGFFVAAVQGPAAGSYPGAFYTVNGDMNVTSSATVRSTHQTAAYTLTFATTGAAAAGKTAGFVDPQAETVTFPKGWDLNLGFLKRMIPYSDIDNPSASGKKPIGTLTIDSPDIGQIEGNNSDITATGKVYVVKSPSATKVMPELELWIPGASTADGDVVVMGKLSGALFPLTVSFSSPVLLHRSISGAPYSSPLPFSRLSVQFPAASSPYILPSCRSVAAPKATVTDALAPFAQDFGDYTDGGASGIYGSPTAVAIHSTKTVVKDACKK